MQVMNREVRNEGPHHAMHVDESPRYGHRLPMCCYYTGVVIG